ncbi:MAG TPA: OadG family protein [Christensenellaceae bacterium]|jgi:sodium pump decarboxylase gamma subunit|nr:OadG family protein [Christensenellaceae bacterium]
MSGSVLGNGLSTMIIGLTVVFIGLILLIGVISLMRFTSGGKAVPDEKVEIKSAASVAPPVPPATDNTELIIAITAAIYAVMAQEGVTQQPGFVVRRIRRY